eukprot:1178669-Amphidinium_carterae.1
MQEHLKLEEAAAASTRQLLEKRIAMVRGRLRISDEQVVMHWRDKLLSHLKAQVQEQILDEEIVRAM